MNWLTSTEAAEYASVSVNTIRDAAERGDLSGVKITNSQRERGGDVDRRHWRFKTTDIDEWLEVGRTTGLRVPRRRRRGAA